MPPLDKQPAAKGTKPEWLNLPRRRCDSCGSRYKPTRPNSRFCKEECKTTFHRHGGAFVKLRDAMVKEIGRQMALEEPCPNCQKSGRGKKKPAADPRTCPRCKQGKILTPYGRQVIAALSRHMLAYTAEDSPVKVYA